MLDLTSIIARVLQADNIGEIVAFNDPQMVGTIDVQTQIMNPHRPGEGQVLLTYDGAKYAINVERWEGYVG